MKMLAFVALSALIALALAAPTASDAALSRSLVGTWLTDTSEEKDWVGETTFNADGTGVDLVYKHDGPKSSGFKVTMRWSVKDGVLIYTAVDSTDSQRAPIGLTLQDRIISISTSRFTYELYKGYSPNAVGHRSTKVRKLS